MGKKSTTVKDRVCLICQKTHSTTSKGLKKHARKCRG